MRGNLLYLCEFFLHYVDILLHAANHVKCKQWTFHPAEDLIVSATVKSTLAVHKRNNF